MRCFSRQETDAELGQTGAAGLASVETLDDSAGERNPIVNEDGMETVRLDVDGADGEPPAQRPFVLLVPAFLKRRCLLGINLGVIDHAIQYICLCTLRSAKFCSNRKRALLLYFMRILDPINNQSISISLRYRKSSFFFSFFLLLRRRGSIVVTRFDACQLGQNSFALTSSYYSSNTPDRYRHALTQCTRKIDSDGRYLAGVYHLPRLPPAQGGSRSASPEGRQVHRDGDVVRTGAGRPGGRRVRVPRDPVRVAADQQSSMATGRVDAPDRALLERHVLGAQRLRYLLAARALRSRLRRRRLPLPRRVHPVCTIRLAAARGGHDRRGDPERRLARSDAALGQAVARA